MTREIFNLYKTALPDIVRADDAVMEILNDTNLHIINYRNDDKLAGVSVIGGNTIYLLCVDEKIRNRGIGGDLLYRSEQYITVRGFDKIVIGAGKDYITPGIPMKHGAHDFFKKRGYIHSWGDCGCFDMELMLCDFNYTEHSVGDTIDEITYRWAVPNDIDNIVKCVSDAAENFVRYYKETQMPVLIAVKDNEVLGTLIVSIEAEGKDIGSVGCTATAIKYRNKGIATNLVRLGTKYLKDIGLYKACLGYTYTQILNMYGRVGYKISMEYFMGEKSVINEGK